MRIQMIDQYQAKGALKTVSELEIIQHQQINGISIFFDTVEYRTPHFHPEWELIWIIKGSLSVLFQQYEIEAQTGAMFLFCPNQLHEFRQIDKGATFLCLQVSPSVFAHSCPELRVIALEDSRVDMHLSEKAQSALYSLMKDLMTEYLHRSGYYALRCTSLCAQIIDLLLTEMPSHTMSEEERTSTDKRNARLSRFLEFVDENYMHKIRLADFAEMEGCTVSYMSRFLKQNMNQSFQEYVNTVRFHSACRMIRAGGMRMLDICEEAGFSDYRYFSNCFREQCGMTPVEYSRTAGHLADNPGRRSLHTVEHFYTWEESLSLLHSLR